MSTGAQPPSQRLCAQKRQKHTPGGNGHRPSYPVGRLRQEIRERFLDFLAGNTYAAILVALVVGISAPFHPAVAGIDRTGVNHQNV